MDFNNAKASEAIMMPSWQWNLHFFKVYETSNKIIWWLSLILASNEWNDYKHQWLMQKRNHRDLTQEFGRLIMTYHVLVTHILYHIHSYATIRCWAFGRRWSDWSHDIVARAAWHWQLLAGWIITPNSDWLNKLFDMPWLYKSHSKDSWRLPGTTLRLEKIWCELCL